MAQDYGWGVPLFGGLIAGAWLGNRLGFGHGACGGGYGNYGGGYGGYGGACAPGYGAAGYAGCYPGYGGYPDRPRHEDKQDERLSCLEAHIAANTVAIKKDEKIAWLEDKLIREDLQGQIFKATCRKPDGEVFLSPRHLANAYRGESRVLDSHRVGFDGRDGFRDGCRDGRDGFRDGCGCDGNWY